MSNLSPTSEETHPALRSIHTLLRIHSLCDLRSGQSDLHPSVMASQGGFHLSGPLSAISNVEKSQLYLHVFKRYSRYSIGKQKVDCSATPRASGMGSGKWKSKTDEDTDVFQAYDVLCSRNVRRRCSVGSSQSSNVFQRYTELCATRSSSTLHQTVTDVGCRVSRPVSVG
ncbi:hypothetical protein Tco_1568169, partial [Tanacetum coccineum]